MTHQKKLFENSVKISEVSSKYVISKKGKIYANNWFVWNLTENLVKRVGSEKSATHFYLYL